MCTLVLSRTQFHNLREKLQIKCEACQTKNICQIEFRHVFVPDQEWFLRNQDWPAPNLRSNNDLINLKMYIILKKCIEQSKVRYGLYMTL